MSAIKRIGGNYRHRLKREIRCSAAIMVVFVQEKDARMHPYTRAASWKKSRGEEEIRDKNKHIVERLLKQRRGTKTETNPTRAFSLENHQQTIYAFFAFFSSVSLFQSSVLCLFSLSLSMVLLLLVLIQFSSASSSSPFLSHPPFHISNRV